VVVVAETPPPPPPTPVVEVYLGRLRNLIDSNGINPSEILCRGLELVEVDMETVVSVIRLREQ